MFLDFSKTVFYDGDGYGSYYGTYQFDIRKRRWKGILPTFHSSSISSPTGAANRFEVIFEYGYSYYDKPSSAP